MTLKEQAERKLETPAALYAECADEDRALAETGMGDYTVGLAGEDAAQEVYLGAT